MKDESLACVACGKAWRRTRGCCSGCYQRHAAAVRAGGMTWAELEAAGQALPARGRRMAPAIRAMWDGWHRGGGG